MTPEDELILKALASVPLREYVKVSPSVSVAVTVPTAVWFSAALKEAAEVMTGTPPISFRSVTLMI